MDPSAQTAAPDAVERAREARDTQARASENARERAAPPRALIDPLPTCIWTTVALIAWIASPPLTVTVFAVIGLSAYARAWRAGLRETRCFLRDPRWVMLYLALAAAAGLAASILLLTRRLSAAAG